MFCSQSADLRASHLGTVPSAPSRPAGVVHHPSARAGVDDCPLARRMTVPWRQGAPNPPVSLCQRVLLLCMAREEERGQESDGREAGENETKDKLSVLTFLPSLPRPLPQLIVSSNHWPYHDRDHGVSRGAGEWRRGKGRTPVARRRFGRREQRAPFAPSTRWQQGRRGQRAPLALTARRRCGRRGRRAPLAPSARTRAPFAHSARRRRGRCIPTYSLRSSGVTVTVTL